jgi:hypothetical protein
MRRATVDKRVVFETLRASRHAIELDKTATREAANAHFHLSFESDWKEHHDETVRLL